MITVGQINKLRVCGVNSLELLTVLLATEHEVRIGDLCELAHIQRRTLELMVKKKYLFLERRFQYEHPDGFEGAPRTKVAIRTALATRILREVFGDITDVTIVPLRERNG